MTRARSLSRRTLPAGLVLVAVVIGLLWYAGHQGAAEGAPSAAGTSTAHPSRGWSGAPTPDSGLPTVASSDLPTAARVMLVTIHAGGPFRYREDGQTFANRERILPSQPSGYYKEYTVKTGASGDRGPLRIIGGHSGDLYWTGDHYAHFQQIREGDE